MNQLNINLREKDIYAWTSAFMRVFLNLFVFSVLKVIKPTDGGRVIWLRVRDEGNTQINADNESQFSLYLSSDSHMTLRRVFAVLIIKCCFLVLRQERTDQEICFYWYIFQQQQNGDGSIVTKNGGGGGGGGANKKKN